MTFESMDRVRASLDDVLMTAELEHRPTRAPDYEAENRALTALAKAMADSPQTILQQLADTALEVCSADSAGLSILEPGGAAGVFRWHAIAGQFASNAGGTIPREASPCGVVLDRNTPLLFSYPERHFAFGAAISPPIVEALLAPFHTEGKPVGTVWVIAHTPQRQFDAEDERLLTNLSRFAAVAYQMRAALVTTDAGLKAKADEVRQILGGAAIGLTHCSRDLRYLACNPAYAKLVGLPAEQIIGRPMVEVTGSEAFEVIRPYIEQVLRGERVEYEQEAPFAANGPRFLHVVYEPWLHSEGQVTGWIASFSEITNIKRTTEALRESEERLRLAMSSGTIGVWERDIVNDRYTLSTELPEIFGVAPGSLQTYEDFRSRIHPDDLAATESGRDAAIRNRAQFDLEFRIIRPSGEIRWLSARGRGHYDENGRVVSVAGINIDITDRVQAKEALREREQRLKLALDASRGGSWTWDIATNRHDWDDRFRKLYGFGPEELPTFDAWLSRVHEEDRSSMLSLLDEVMQRRTRHDWDNTYRIVHPNGTVLWIESRGHADCDAEGQLTWLTGLELDVTDRRRAEEALQARRTEERDRALQKEAEDVLRRSHSELEQRTLQLSRLASQLTLTEQSVRKQLASTLHDGLQQLLFSAGITLDQAVKPSSQDDQVELLRRARALVSEAVEAARTLTVNLFPPVLHAGGLPAALRWLAKRTQEQYNVVVNVTADPQANPETGEVRILLFEGVRELLFNAVKHARVDRVDVRLALGPGDTIQIQVSDDGAGFDPSVLYDRNQPHAGLGLFSIQERLALLGGHLDIVSAPGTGSQFTLTLPRTGLARLGTEGPHRDTDRRGSLAYNVARGTSKSLRLLIADDHVVVRAGLRELFGERSELRVVGEAANGVEAISQAKTLQPDVILMDVAMPQKNGIEATREIHDTLPHIQIVGLSTYGDEITERAMREAGAQAYFSKTESTDRLFDYVLSLRPQAKGASGT